MEKCLKNFEVKVKEAKERLMKGVEELENGVDAAMYQFLIKGNEKEGEARTERFVRRMKAAALKSSFDLKEAKKEMFQKIRELERERRRREDEMELTIAAEEVELQVAREKSSMEDEEVQTEGCSDDVNPLERNDLSV